LSKKDGLEDTHERNVVMFGSTCWHSSFPNSLSVAVLLRASPVEMSGDEDMDASISKMLSGRLNFQLKYISSPL
jgi:hypothetical protein